MGFLSAPAMALGERPARPRFVSGPRRGPSTARRLFQCSPPPPSSEPPPREAAPGWPSLHFSEAGYQFCRFLSPPVLMCAVLMKPWLLFHPSLRVRARPVWRSPLVGKRHIKERGDRFSSFHRRKFLLPQDDQGAPTPSDKTSSQRIGRRAPRVDDAPRQAATGCPARWSGNHQREFPLSCGHGQHHTSRCWKKGQLSHPDFRPQKVI